MRINTLLRAVQQGIWQGRTVLFVIVYLQSLFAGESFFVSDPFLQFPTKDSVKVVWFTFTKGMDHIVEWGSSPIAVMASSKMILGWEKIHSVWRHEATIENIPPYKKFPYCVISHDEKNVRHNSAYFTLSAAPPDGKALKILLTSDHQCRKLIAMNLWQAKKVTGNFDAVFFAGDFVNTANNFNYWFLHPQGVFPYLQGKAHVQMHNQIYQGAEIIQNTPIFPALGNHDAEEGKKTPWHIFNNIFSLPLKKITDPPYYSVTFGNIHLIVLAVARIIGKGIHYVSIAEDSEQYCWLLKELQSNEFINADIRIVMLHHPIYTLNPDKYFLMALSNKGLFHKDSEYKYIGEKPHDFFPQYSLGNVLEPLFEQHGVDLVFSGHDHIWNHFCSPKGVHYFSSSQATPFGIISSKDRKTNCRGLDGIIPNIKPFEKNGISVPYMQGGIATFSVLDTKTKTISSYYCYFDKGQAKFIKFDSFSLHRENGK